MLSIIRWMIPLKVLMITTLPKTVSGLGSDSQYGVGETPRHASYPVNTCKPKANTFAGSALWTRMSLTVVALLIVSAQLAGCNTMNNRSADTLQSCTPRLGHNLDKSFATARHALSNGCAHYFDDYFDRLLTIGEGDPNKHNKRRFSEFLVWSADEGIISKRQATNLYNRYFNVKFIALMGDYNNCSHTCPKRQTVIANMGRELADKERGLLKVSADSAAYYQADHLLKEAELVLEATCTACITRR